MPDEAITPALSTGFARLIDVSLTFTILVICLIVSGIVIKYLAKELKEANQKVIDIATNSNTVLTEIKTLIISAVQK